MQRSSLYSSTIHARQTQHQLNQEQEFLSHELGQSVKELPPFFTRLLGIGISTLLLGTLIWAHLSKIDEVAVASGQFVPSEQMRPVRSLAQGTIQVVYVEEGDRVEAGEVLVKRDPAITQAEIDRLKQSIQLIQEDIARLEAERVGSNSTGTALQDQFLAARLQDFTAQQAGAIAEANRQLAIRDEAAIRLVRLQENLTSAQIILTNAEKREASIRELASESNGAVSHFAYLEVQDGLTQAQNEVISLERDIEAQQQTIRQADQAYQVALTVADRLASERQSEILATLNQRREELANVQGQLQTATRQLEQETITAPIGGTVYNLKATTGPVQSGEELLSILPQGEEIILEVKVMNRDIGFVRPGMTAKVKIATFPFQEFGTITGEVMDISPDAIEDETLGLVFPTQVKLHQQTISVPGQGTIRLTPGMIATGEIVTRQKSILAFVLEPVAKQLSEAFSVR